jgi:hypothetical protein
MDLIRQMVTWCSTQFGLWFVKRKSKITFAESLKWAPGL